MCTKQPLTEADCHQVLQNYYHGTQFNIINVHFEPFFDCINGFLGQHLRLRIKHTLRDCDDVDKELTFFVKCVPDPKSGVYQFIQENKSFLKETFIYTQFLGHAKQFMDPDVTVTVMPKMFYASPSVVAFEDLSVRGYSLPVRESGVNENYALLALRKLAHFHAMSFVIEENEKRRRNHAEYTLLDDYADILEEGMFVDGPTLRGNQLNECSLKAILCLSEKLFGESETFRKRFKRKYEEMMREFSSRHSSFRRVLSHGDLWFNNLLFCTDKVGKYVDCLLVDFQMMRYSPPAHDVTFFLYHSLNEDMMHRSYYKLLKKYYEFLGEDLKRNGLDVRELLPLAEYETSCKMFLVYAQIIKAFYGTLNQASDKCVKEITANDDSFYRYLFEDRMAGVLKCWNEDAKYRRIMTKMIGTIHDAVANPVVDLKDCYNIVHDVVKDQFVIENYALCDRMNETLLTVNIVRKNSNNNNNEASEALKFSVKTEDPLANTEGFRVGCVNVIKIKEENGNDNGKV